MKLRILIITIFIMTMMLMGCSNNTESTDKNIEPSTAEKSVSIEEYYSKMTYDMVTDSLSNQGDRPEKYQNIISTPLFSKLNFAAVNYYKADGPYDETKSFTYPTTTVETDKIICKYQYSYQRYEKGTKNLWGGSWDVPVTITYELKNGEWYVSNVYERP